MGFCFHSARVTAVYFQDPDGELHLSILRRDKGLKRVFCSIVVVSLMYYYGNNTLNVQLSRVIPYLEQCVYRLLIEIPCLLQCHRDVIKSPSYVPPLKWYLFPGYSFFLNKCKCMQAVFEVNSALGFSPFIIAI